MSDTLNAECVDLARFNRDTTSDESTSNTKQPADFLGKLAPDKLEQSIQTSRSRMADADRLKLLLRANNWSPTHTVRANLWRFLLKSLSKKESDEALSEYDHHLNQIFGKLRNVERGLPEFAQETSASSHLNYYFLNDSGREAIKRILCVFEYRHPHVTFSPSIVSISSLLLHYMSEHEVFAALCHMSAQKDYLTESKTSWTIMASVFVRLVKSYCKSSYDILNKYGTDTIEAILADWYWWIFDCLPFGYLIKVMDCFLYEGQKIFFRVSLSIVEQFTKYIAFIESFDYLSDYYVNVVKNKKIKVTKSSIRLFCESPGSLESIDKLLKSSFSIRNLKRSTIKDLYAKEELKRKDVDYVSATPNQATNNVTLKNTDNNNNSTKPNDSFELNQTTLNRTFLQETSTKLLTHSSLNTIWNWLPQRFSVSTPRLLFTTEEHGTSINTLYNILDELEYCLIVIKTLKNELFGSFCSAAWSDRRKKVIYFGNGETFLFTLMPEKKVYRWVGSVGRKNITSTQELFIRADSSKIAIGGGGSDGLVINSSLTDGHTNRCETFENEPLCSTQHFEIASLEVVGFD